MLAYHLIKITEFHIATVLCRDTYEEAVTELRSMRRNLPGNVYEIAIVDSTGMTLIDSIGMVVIDCAICGESADDFATKRLIHRSRENDETTVDVCWDCDNAIYEFESATLGRFS